MFAEKDNKKKRRKKDFGVGVGLVKEGNLENLKFMPNDSG